MSDHTICDKCMKVIDLTQPWVRITQTGLVNEPGPATVQTESVIYDYHPNHAPKLTKGKPEEPEEPDEPVINPLDEEG